MGNLLLSIDGGGALGIGPAALMAHLEEKVGGIRFGAYAGSSVGALLVALAATGRSWTHIREIFREECRNIFEAPSLLWRLNIFKPKYDNRPLRAAAQKYLGEISMRDLEVPVFLTSFDFKTGHPKVFDRADDVPVWKVVLCSAAAPTFFPIIDGRWGDGGLVANNPAVVGLAGCVAKERWSASDSWCLSMGTNGDAWNRRDVSRRTKIGWIKPLLDTFMCGGEELANFEARAFLENRLLRLEPSLKHDYQMDDVESALGPYRKIWDNLWWTECEEIVQWLNASKQKSRERDNEV